VRAENYLDRRGGIAVFLSRFLPVLHSVIPLTVGMSTMSYRRFMTWTIPASVLWAFAYVSVGSLAGGSYRELSDTLHSAGYIFVGIIAVFLLLVLVAKKVLGKLEARHMERREGTAHHDATDTPDGTDASETPSSGSSTIDPHTTRGRTP
jgi:membrane-associated protein